MTLPTIESIRPLNSERLNNLDMYQLPDEPLLSQKDIERYDVSNRHFDESITGRVTRSLKDPKEDLESFNSLSHLPLLTIEQQDIIQEAVVKRIEDAINIARNKGNYECPEMMSAIKYLRFVSPTDRTKYYDELFESRSSEVAKEALMSMEGDIGTSKIDYFHKLSRMNFTDSVYVWDFVKTAFTKEDVSELVSRKLNDKSDPVSVSLPYLASTLRKPDQREGFYKGILEAEDFESIEDVADLLNTDDIAKSIEAAQLATKIVKTFVTKPYDVAYYRRNIYPTLVLLSKLPKEQIEEVQASMDSLTEAAIRSPEPETKEHACSSLKYCSDDALPSLIDLASSQKLTANQVIYNFGDLPEKFRSIAAIKCFTSMDIGNGYTKSKYSMDAFKYLPDSQKVEAALRLLRFNEFHQGMYIFANLTARLSEDQRIELTKLIHEEINGLIEKDSLYGLPDALLMVRYLPKNEALEAFNTLGSIHNLSVQAELNRYNAWLKHFEDDGEALVIEHQPYGSATGEPLPVMLYNGIHEPFIHKKQSKTGSSTTLLGDSTTFDFSLKYRATIRTLKFDCYQTWRYAYENSDFWSSMGFDYVPIEPIIGVRESDDPTNSNVEVYTKVLGNSIDNWLKKTDLFREDLIAQKSKIIKALELLNIEHGHDHGDNFCMWFYKNTDGTPDFSRPPRVYMIDFDRSQVKSTFYRPTDRVERKIQARIN